MSRLITPEVGEINLRVVADTVMMNPRRITKGTVVQRKLVFIRKERKRMDKKARTKNRCPPKNLNNN